LFSFAPYSERSSSADHALIREIRFGENDPFCSPLFADGHASLVFSLGRLCHLDGRWSLDPAEPQGRVIGPMTRVGATSLTERPEMVGAYLNVGQVRALTGAAAWALTDRVVALDDLWGASGNGLAAELSLLDEASRIQRLESTLLARLGSEGVTRSAVDVAALTGWVLRRRGRVTVQQLVDGAGTSRQHLARLFREQAGVTPKLYSRLARFHAGLRYAGRGGRGDWAQVALEMGYADQSHMIAEFRRFSSLTPGALAGRRWFHPFIEHAREPDRRA
jgi:AraC-like DNA-binding protein